MTNDRAASIEAEGLVREFKKGPRAVDGIDLRVAPGEIGPPSKTYGCCTAVGLPGSLDQIGSVPGNKVSADCDYYITKQITVTVPGGDCFPCAVLWIDNTHFVVAAYGGAAQVFASGPEPLQALPTTAKGLPLARIPGGLD